VPDSKVNPPREVVTAVSLLSVNILCVNAPRTIAVVTGILSGRIAGDDIVFKIMDEILIWGFSIGLLALLWHGFNWARWLNLILSVLNIGLMSYSAAGLIAAQRYLALTPTFVYALLELIALYLLFLSPGRLWFDHRGNPSAA
jgi:hypothetical protein